MPFARSPSPPHTCRVNEGRNYSYHWTSPHHSITQLTLSKYYCRHARRCCDLSRNLTSRSAACKRLQTLFRELESPLFWHMLQAPHGLRLLHFDLQHRHTTIGPYPICIEILLSDQVACSRLTVWHKRLYLNESNTRAPPNHDIALHCIFHYNKN